VSVEDRPSVTFVLVNHNGERHLHDALTSIRALDYDGEYDIVVVDNASTDGSLKILGGFNEVRVLAEPTNLGFAAGCNAGVAASDAECVAFVNTDMRLDPGWLTQAVAKYDPRSGYSCVAGLILDWDGDRIDFADAIVNYHGMASQVGFGVRVDKAAVEDGRELPFACGGAMLIGRSAFLDVGGFDPAYFAYFEDVDLGWRLRLAGNRIRLAAGARAFHRHHGTAGAYPSFQRALLLERNALRSLIKNVDDENLGRLLPAALMLLIERVLVASGSDRADYDFGARSERETETIARSALAPLHAVGDIVAELDSLIDERRRIQARRRVSDPDVFASFGRPFEPLGSASEGYLEAMTSVTQALRIDDLFGRRRATRVLVIGYDVIGGRMAGPGVRSWELAHALARHAPVTLAFTHRIERESPSVDIAYFATGEELGALVEEADVVVFQGFAVEGHRLLTAGRAIRVVDLYDPWIFEHLEDQRARSPASARTVLRRDVDVQRQLLSAGDFFICASERQRDYWLGMLTAVGRLDGPTYEHDETLRSLIDVVPYGCPEDEPPRASGTLRNDENGIADDDFVVLWTGGTWEWFDPIVVLDAFESLREAVPNSRLVFMGLELEGRGVPAQQRAQEVRDECARRSLLGDGVVLADWIPYDQRGAFMREADVAVIATRRLAESRLAFRSRTIDHFWTGLPTVTTSGDVLAEVVEREGAGIVVEPGDVASLAQALTRLASDADLRHAMSARALRLADDYRWTKVVEPMRRVIEEPWRWRALRANRDTPVAMTEDAQRLLAEWRRAVPQATAPAGGRGVARTAWSRTPEPVRRRLRPMLRRIR